ncbi:MAG: flagellar biosynthesis protein FlhF [Pseudomonadota bacterium]|nr:flagellar biosynthesis protein FlhF [Pseudomonadota bacterium]
MRTQRFFGATAREALARVKTSLGEDAVILRNRRVDGGVEILATTDADWSQDEAMAPSGPTRHASADAPPPARGTAAAGSRKAARPPEMSTVSFERYAQERSRPAQAPSMEGVSKPVDPQPRQPEPVAPLRIDGHGEQATALANQHLVDELRRMRAYISQQFSALSWVDGVRRSPVQAQLLRLLIGAGFSARLSRLLVSRVPGDYDDDEALVWLHAALARNLRCAAWTDGPLADGGVFAMVGPTGVGKTTTTAKIAARFALRHGVQSVGLITMDAYRIAAQDQLRAFGELIGVPVLAAHDADELGRHLATLADRRLVLVDTAGVGQRDERVAANLDMLADKGVRPLLVLAATAQEGALEEVIEAYRGRDAAGVVLSKIDEAPRLGGAIDALVRHRLQVVGMADGQRVPEDWHEADAAGLVATALEPRMHDDFVLDDTELTMLMQRIDGMGADAPAREALHA